MKQDKTRPRQVDYVVAVDCVNTFKTKLDKYWKDQDVMHGLQMIANSMDVSRKQAAMSCFFQIKI